MGVEQEGTVGAGNAAAGAVAAVREMSFKDASLQGGEHQSVVGLGGGAGGPAWDETGQ